MEILNILVEHKMIFSCLIGILIINFGCIFYLVMKERKSDKEEIDDLLNDLSQPKKGEIKIDNIEKEKQEDATLEKNKAEVEEMLVKMQKDLETKPEDVVTNFENEQEEKSIISYQELLNNVKEKKDVLEVNVQPVKIEIDEEPEIFEEKKSPKTTVQKLKATLFDDDDTLELEPIKDKKFKTTDFISPIFGKQDNKIKYPTVPKHEEIDEYGRTDNILDQLDFGNNNIEKQIDTTPLQNEIKKNDEFLKALKDFRKNLD